MVFGTYNKGSRAEHELMKKMQEKGFLVIRAAGSGVGSPCPDILAFRRTAQMGFECKAINDTSLQLRKEQVEQLKAWQDVSGITTYVAWRLQGGEWRFIRPEHLRELGKSYSITLKEARKFGVLFDELFVGNG
ncbi:MAG: Holliday junction resolvase Hjc [Candidatus Micrarchaeota archaeon]